jgi:hypothetical protein
LVYLVPKLANTYSNWTYANQTDDFCYGTNSDACLDPNANCQNDSQRMESFCQCLLPYTLNDDRKECGKSRIKYPYIK